MFPRKRACDCRRNGHENMGFLGITHMLGCRVSMMKSQRSVHEEHQQKSNGLSIILLPRQKCVTGAAVSFDAVI